MSAVHDHLETTIDQALALGVRAREAMVVGEVVEDPGHAGMIGPERVLVEVTGDFERGQDEKVKTDEPVRLRPVHRMGIEIVQNFS